MSGATSISSASASFVPADHSDGVAVVASRRLEPVKYPNRLQDIAVIGRTGNWRRNFLLRPKYGGRFLFLLYPVDRIDQESVLFQAVHFPGFNTAPKIVEMRIPPELRNYDDWDWRLVKTTFYDSAENDFELMEAVERPPDGFLEALDGASLAMSAERNGRLSHLIFETRPALKGHLRFSEERDRGESRQLTWSCHQPFDSKDGKAEIHPLSEGIMEWYRAFAESFDPHRVWALGDTAYSDGTGTLNFVQQVYNNRGWHNNWDLRKDLLSLYRLNYRYHWSFEPMQRVMCNYPHIAMWDDHEIRDGYGSDALDFKEENKVMKELASQAAEEYLFSWNERLRSEAGRNFTVDNHLAYVDNPVACFVFDGRNNRNYGEDLPIPADIPIFASIIVGFLGGTLAAGPIAGAVTGSTSVAATVAIEKELIDIYRWHNPGAVISDQQLDDFERFCNHIRGLPDVRYLLLGNSVPFVYVNDMIEALASELEIMATSVGKHVRDDIRDSWHSPGNRRQLNKLIDILRHLHAARPDMELINLSGDIHMSNAFTFQPDGFNKPCYQITTSALTNRGTLSDSVSNLLSVGGPLGFLESSDDFGDVHRLWHEANFQNFLSVKATGTEIEFHLHVFNKEDEQAFGGRDQKLRIQSGKGYELRSGV